MERDKEDRQSSVLQQLVCAVAGGSGVLLSIINTSSTYSLTFSDENPACSRSSKSDQKHDQKYLEIIMLLL